MLLETRSDRIAVLTLNRPDSLNALDTTLMKRLAEAVRSAADDSSVGCVVLTGAGRGFCAGGDVRAIGKAADDRVKGVALPQTSDESRTQWLRRSVEAARILHEMPKPTIAMINGACAGAGLSLAGACDLRFASASAVFKSAFTSNGLPGDYGGSWFWSQILGTAKARELYLLDEKRDAGAALDFGLVNRVYPDDRLADEVMAIAARLAAFPATGLAFAKANLNAAAAQDLAHMLDLESHNMMLARSALIASRKAGLAEAAQAAG